MIPASIPSPPAAWSVIPLGPLQIHTYAVCILVGIIVAVVVTSRRLTKRGAQPGVVVDFAILAVPLALIGARAWHVLTHVGDYFGPTHAWWEPFAIWEGGNAIFGSVLGGAVGVLLASRWTGIRFLSFADALAPGLLLAQAIGRIGNWFNIELFGLPTALPWGLEVPSDNPAFPAGLLPGTLFQPTFLYELIWDAAGAVVILLAERRVALRWGRALGVYLVWYGAGRAVFESIRIDPTTVLLGLRVNIWAAFLAVLLGIAIIVRSRRRHPGREPSVYLPGRVWTSDAPLVSRYTAADFEGEPPVDQASAAATSSAGSRR